MKFKSERFINREKHFKKYVKFAKTSLFTQSSEEEEKKGV